MTDSLDPLLQDEARQCATPPVEVEPGRTTAIRRVDLGEWDHDLPETAPDLRASGAAQGNGRGTRPHNRLFQDEGAALEPRLALELKTMFTLFTFGDSLLDCGHYNDAGLTPGHLLVHNNDELFPDFRGQDLQSILPARLEQRARDGATVADLPHQTRGLRVEGPSVALLSIGGNDLLWGMETHVLPDPARFARQLNDLLGALPIRPVLVATI